jgi:hypothetical protein
MYIKAIEGIKAFRVLQNVLFAPLQRIIFIFWQYKQYAAWAGVFAH